MQTLKKLLVNLLRDVALKIEAGECELTSDEVMDVMQVLSHEPMSKEKACVYLNLSRSRFDDYVREGKLPKGRHSLGFKELRWYKDELNSCVEKFRKHKKGGVEDEAY